MAYSLHLPPGPGPAPPTVSSPSLPGPVIAVMTGDGAGFDGMIPRPAPTPEPADNAPGPYARTWLLDLAGHRLSLADFYRVREFRFRGCPESFWFARDETVVTQLLRQQVPPSLIWTEAEVVDVLMAEGLTEVGLRRLVATKLAVDGEMVDVRTTVSRRPVRWPKPKITYGRSCTPEAGAPE
jgi:hypothetical protein